MTNENRPTEKKLLRIHQSSGMHWVGNGFPVRSVFDYNGLGRELSPFLLLDYAAPYQFPAGHEKRGVGGHPHKGFETVTVAVIKASWSIAIPAAAAAKSARATCNG